MSATKTLDAGKILFITMPADGHFSPLTGLAKHLQSEGYDVRWYTQDLYRDKLERLGIPFYPHVKAPQLNQHNFESFFTERANQKSQPAKFRFDLEHCFIRPSEAVLADVEEVYEEFRFDLVIGDLFAFCLPMVKTRLNVPVISIGVVPLMQTSKDLGPAGLGLTPQRGLFGKIKEKVLHLVSQSLVFKKPTELYREVLAKYGVSLPGRNVFDMLYASADVVLQSGTPSFEYKRSDLLPNIHYAGPLLPYHGTRARQRWFDERLKTYKHVVLVTQGTVEKDFTKLLVPTLDALKGTDTLVVCTTGGSGTAGLRTRFNYPNIIIEDFIPFEDVMPYADVYITNGGYGGVMLGVKNGVPMVVAGVHEGKNEICARVGYFGYGINLKTERPSGKQIGSAIKRILANPSYRSGIKELQEEFLQYKPNEICQTHVEALFAGRQALEYSSAAVPEEDTIYTNNG